MTQHENATGSREPAGSAGIRLALCQVGTEPWDVDGNAERTVAALEEAAAGGASLAITPEVVFQGYPSHASPEDRARLRAIAEPVDGPLLTRVRDVAARTGIDAVVGFAELAADGATIHNSCAYVTGDGSVRAIYRKVHCRPFEDAAREGLYAAGDRFVVVDHTARGASCRVGLFICFDREIPESTRCLRALGAELIACPLATDTCRLDEPGPRVDNEMLTRSRAAENEVSIAVVNHAWRFNGGSFLVGPAGEVLVQLDDQPQVYVLDVPVDRVRREFRSDPLGWAGWGHRRPEVYRRYLDRP